jgi:quinol monooxygenase YgiN
MDLYNQTTQQNGRSRMSEMMAPSSQQSCCPHIWRSEKVLQAKEEWIRGGPRTECDECAAVTAEMKKEHARINSRSGTTHHTDGDRSCIVLALLDVEPAQSAAFCDIANAAATKTRHDPANAFAYGLQRFHPDAATDDECSFSDERCVLDNMNQCNYLAHSTFETVQDMKTSLAKKYNVEMQEMLLSADACRSLPRVGLWKPCHNTGHMTNPHFARTGILTVPQHGRGRYFMLRVNHLHGKAPRKLVLESLFRLAALSFLPRKKKGLPHDDDRSDGHGHCRKRARRGGASKKCGDHGAYEDDEAKAPAASPSGCVFYEILESQDADRHSEIVEWASWSSKEALQEHLQHSSSLHFDTAVMACNRTTRDVTYWERNEDGLHSPILE